MLHDWEIQYGTCLVWAKRPEDDQETCFFFKVTDHRGVSVSNAGWVVGGTVEDLTKALQLVLHYAFGEKPMPYENPAKHRRQSLYDAFAYLTDSSDSESDSSDSTLSEGEPEADDEDEPPAKRVKPDQAVVHQGAAVSSARQLLVAEPQRKALSGSARKKKVTADMNAGAKRAANMRRGL